jgi:electron transfer flavoprotein alpha subunit
VKIAVCVKQVPRLDQVEFHPKTNRIVREGVETEVNPLDLKALGHGLALRESAGGEVLVITMGPPSARRELEDAVRRGADRAVHLVDQRFAGADTLATARALAHALRLEELDLVLFGRSTLDGATAQVGPQVAELLGVAQLTQATELEADGEGGLLVTCETERGAERWRAPLPLAVTVERGPDPPSPDPERTPYVEEREGDALGGGPRDYGTRGSKTYVTEVNAVSIEREIERLEGVRAGAERIEALVRERVRELDSESAAGEVREREPTRALWVLAEHDRDGLHPVSFEGLACARQVAGQLDAEVVSVLLCADPGDAPRELAAHGADRVLVLRHPALAEYATEPYTAAVAEAVEAREPFAVIGPWSAQGRDYVPRMAARLGLGLTGDFTGLRVEDPDTDDPDLLWLKPAWAGTVEAPIIAHTEPSVGTLRPGVFAVPTRHDGREVPVEELEPGGLSGGGGGEQPRREGGEVHVDAATLLDAAPIVVCVGEDLSSEGARSAERLAHALGGSFGATAAAVAAGHAPPQLEVGVLKRSIAPLLFLALGVHEEQDLAAVRGARTIVTVDADGHAPAHRRADLAVAADPAEIASALLERHPASEAAQ